jgi:diaminohydroxyphosphoribosylaminopyrimidine deaminase/5-amino-6-(5-phosphoribosylamino)uracil reductase
VTPHLLDDRRWLERAIELSFRCPPITRAYSVGSIIVDADGTEIASGYSRETDPVVHAEEAALAKLATDDPRLRSATMYSTLEPCSERKRGQHTCAQLLIAAGIPRVVIAWREPPLFVEDCQGVELLAAAGIEVVELTDLEPRAREANTHLPWLDAESPVAPAVAARIGR